MMLSHYRFTLEFQVLSDLHLGTGDTQKLSAVRNSNHGAREGADPDVSLTAKDAAGMPYLSSTALKAAARHVVAAAGRDDLCDSLFGKISSTTTRRQGNGEIATSEGQMGRLSFGWGRMAPVSADASEGADLPLYDPKTRCWIATRTRIDGATGTVKRHHLFNREYITRGTRFEVDCLFIGTEEEVIGQLGAVLGLIDQAGYLEVGQGGRLGNGRIKLRNRQIAGTMTCFDAASFETKSRNMKVVPVKEAAGRPASTAAWQLALRATSPFLVADPYGRGGEDAGQNDDKDKGRSNVICALRTVNGGPALPSSSLFGVLRARAVWLACVENPDHRDDPDLKPSVWKTASDLSVTERLFGVTGWRGTLELDRIADANPNSYAKTFSGIAIDRFSGGVIDGALFSVEAFCHAAFDVGLKLADRGGKTLQDAEFVSRLVAMLTREGLEIGHGTNNGFGWFNVSGGEKK